MSVNKYDDALNEFEQNRFILGSQARDTLAGDDECIDNFSLNCRPSNYVNLNDLYEYSKPVSADERAIVFWNCQGLRTAYSPLCEILSLLDKKPYIVGLCETFVSSKSLPWDFLFRDMFASEENGQPWSGAVYACVD